MSRDSAVLMIMAFGFGVLVAWALFYVWGSFPTVREFDLPAWTQAIGSVLAILVAIAVPAWQHQRSNDREQRKENARALLAIARANSELGDFICNIQVLGLLGNRTNDFEPIESVIRATTMPASLMELMGTAHEFPDESQYIVRFFSSLGAVNKLARSYHRDFHRGSLQPGSVEALFKHLDICASIGERLSDRFLMVLTQHAGTPPK
ncbi:hypothetical protein RZA67_09840 [Stenotrophomonas sp. C3(2023)]|uniref:hypothetical protein n=1 Tax=Stenotrophomonas sp. C3(2023) TaxID=3080277 RepID=UPI00293C73A4|nr:hypothetical protein [Stenotrophomonas sp. C3(2023)]MDV3469030.1 hypothetical protein [Stenotrophomonas sp. C3(2023)]